MRFTVAFLVAACLVLTPSVGAAQGAVVFPLAGKRLPRPLRKAPAMLTEFMAQELSKRGIDAKIADSPIGDTAMMLGCDPSATRCAEAVAKTLKASELWFGTVTRGRGPVRLRVALTHLVAGGERTEHIIELRQKSMLALGEELATAMGPILGTAEAPAESSAWSTEAVVEVAEPVPPAPAGSPVESLEPPPIVMVAPPVESGGLLAATWTLGGIGVALAAGGGACLFLAQGKSDEVDAAPTQTRAQLAALEDLESTGRLYSYLGTGLVIGGGASLVAAIIVEAVRGDERAAVAVAPWLVGDGGGVVVSLPLEL